MGGASASGASETHGLAIPQFLCAVPRSEAERQGAENQVPVLLALLLNSYKDANESKSRLDRVRALSTCGCPLHKVQVLWEGLVLQLEERAISLG